MKSQSIVRVCRLAVACLVVLSAGTTRAQEGRGGRGAVIGAPDVGAIRYRLQSDTVTGAPYSAEVINESTQTLSDGNRIVRRTRARVYRDNEGRVRREEDRPSGPPSVTITDPVAGRSISLDTENHVTRQVLVPPGRIYSLAPRAELQQLELAHMTVLLNGLATVDWRAPGGAASEQRSEEQLPGRTIEGVWATGVRRTTTIAAGAIGNERPIVVVSEEWTSPDLKMLVLSENNDPRVGKTSYRVVSIVRGDPDPSLFQAPADYAVQPDGGGRGGARGAAPR